MTPNAETVPPPSGAHPSSGAPPASGAPSATGAPHSTGAPPSTGAPAAVSARAPGAAERFDLLDGLRGLAALFVVTDHVAPMWFQNLLPSRQLSVDFFFVLSGFVIAHAYLHRLATGMSALDFMRARVIRLYPLYLLGTIIAAGVALYSYATGQNDPGRWNLAETFTFAFLFLPCPPAVPRCGFEPYPLNGPAWSLFFELAANLAFALVARALTQRRLSIFVALAAAILAASDWVFGRMDVGWAWSHFGGGGARVAYSFFAGVLIYITRSSRRLPAMPAWLGFVCLLAIVAAPLSGAALQIFDLVAALALIPVLVAFAGDAVVTGGAQKFCAALGALSYPLYMVHVPLMRFFDQVVVLPYPNDLARLGIVAALALALAALSYRFYDIPVRRWVGRRLARGGRARS